MSTVNITQCLQPEYFGRFRCDGSKCDAHCCRYWRIDIDEATYKKYRLMPRRQLSRELMKCLAPLEGNPHVYRMALRLDGACPMLNEQRLCRIQRECGEAFLSDICRRFPRFVAVCGDIFYRTLSLACPLAARLVLTNPKPMRLELAPVDKLYQYGFYNLGASPIRRHWRELMDGNLAVLQRRDLAIDERLALLGDYWAAVDEQLATKVDSPESIAALSERFSAKTTFTRPAFDVGACVREFLSLMDDVQTVTASYWRATSEILEPGAWINKTFGLNESGSALLSELTNRYIDARLSFERRVAEPYGYMLENFLANECLVGFYPCRLCGDALANYRQFVTVYKLMETVLACVAAVKGDAFGVDDIIAVMSWMAGNEDHGFKFPGALEEHLKARPSTLEQFMSTWLIAG